MLNTVLSTHQAFYNYLINELMRRMNKRVRMNGDDSMCMAGWGEAS